MFYNQAPCSRYVHLTEESLANEDALPFKIKVVNQFGVEQSHDLCDKEDNLDAVMSNGKPGVLLITPFIVAECSLEKRSRNANDFYLN